MPTSHAKPVTSKWARLSLPSYARSAKNWASLIAPSAPRGPALRSDIRSTPCQGYVIFFRYRADDVFEIVNILHGSRDIDSYFDAH